jgi:hypothetical protein
MKNKPLLFIAAGIVVLGGLFVLFRPSPEPPAPAAAISTAQPEASAAPAILIDVFELVVQGGKLISGPSIIRVSQGEEIIIRVRIDTAEEFHLHGYDRKLDLAPGKPAELRLVVDRSGRFEYELERAGFELGVLEVLPR